MDNNFNRGTTPTGLITPALGSWVTFDKLVYRMVDIPSTGNGREIGIPESGEVRLYSDFPVDVAYETPDHFLTRRTDLWLKGRISKLFVRSNPLLAVGRVVIYVGRPELGVNFQRENPSNMVRVQSNPSLPVAWGAAVTDLSAATWALPTSGLVLPVEAYYLHALKAHRTSGLITEAAFVESESGTSIPLTKIVNEDFSDTLTFRSPVPIRIPGAGVWHLYGNNTGVAGNLDELYFEITLI